MDLTTLFIALFWLAIAAFLCTLMAAAWLLANRELALARAEAAAWLLAKRELAPDPAEATPVREHEEPDWPPEHLRRAEREPQQEMPSPPPRQDAE